MPGRITCEHGDVICATEGFLHTVSMDGMRLLGTRRVSGRASTWLTAGETLLLCDALSECIFAAERRRTMDLFCEHARDMRFLFGKDKTGEAKRMAKMWRRRMGRRILCSMACTTVMLAVQGRIREAIPLHLCSVSALAAAVLAFMPVQPIVDYLWLLGMPGAILALVFPAPPSAVGRRSSRPVTCSRTR